MFFRILKHDLKKKKVMNTILLLFIILATIFSASGLNNIVTVLSGTDYYFDKAGLGDYVIIAKDDDKLLEILDNESCVKGYKYDLAIETSKNLIKIKGNVLEEKNTGILFQSIDSTKLKFFDKDDNEITHVSKGEVYLTGSVLKNNKASIGDELVIDFDDIQLKLKIVGVAKDALMGSDFMGNKRFILNEEDYQIVKKHINTEDVNKEVKIIYVETDDVNNMTKVLSSVTSILFKGARSTLKICYAMDMILAFIVLVLSACLILVALLILKFTITFTINEEYREIGVMKAIGITNGKIRNLYITKYMCLAIVGAIIGVFISIPFGKMMINSTTEKMVLGNSVGYGLNAIGAIAIVIVTILFAYVYTRKVKKATPVDAIRTGQTGERYKAKTLYKMKNSHVRLNLYLAINDILSSPKRFITMIISFFICLSFVLGIVITTDTMRSKNIIKVFCSESDVYFNVTDAEDIFIYKDINDYKQRVLDKYQKILEDNGMPCEMIREIAYMYNITFNGNTYNLFCCQGYNTKAEDYEYKEGIAPTKENEIAITYQISEMTGAKIGDKVTIDFGTEKRECVVTAYFQTLNQLGEVVRLNEKAPSNFKNVAGCHSFQANFTDNPSEEEIKNRIEKMKQIPEIEEVYSAAEYCAECIGVADTMEAVQYLLLGITILVVILVTLLMELSFVTDEKSQIALLKASGFRDIQIIKWHVYRFLIVTIIAEVLAVALAMPITKLWCNPIFGMMGANDMNFYLNPLHVFVIYPGIVLIATIIISFIAATATKRIKSADTANIE